jgi:hypothetical protein
MKLQTLNGAVFGAAVLFTSTSASAAKIMAYPAVQDGVEMRYNRSVPTLQRNDELTTITVTPLQLNRGRLSFAIAAFNKAPGSFNLGVENVTAEFSDGSQTRILTKDDLVRQAKNRAMWAQVGMAFATGLAAAATASTAGQHNYNSTMYTPHGAYRYSGTYVNYTERALATGAVTGGGVYAIASIQNGLDNLVANLGETVLQTTTVDQGSGYGGMIVLDKLRWKPTNPKAKSKVTDQDLILTVSANGRQYKFNFDLK